MIRKIFLKKKPPATPAGPAAQRWSRHEEFDPAWELRTKVMASYIDLPGTVADFGCGTMTLEKYLKPQNPYLPIDLHRRDDRTLRFDVNSDPFPHLAADIAVCSGFLEYVRDIDLFIRGLEKTAFRKFIMSYCTTEHFPDLRHRRALDWVNHLSALDILEKFLPLYDLTAVDDVNRNSIFVWTAK